MKWRLTNAAAAYLNHADRMISKFVTFKTVQKLLINLSLILGTRAKFLIKLCSRASDEHGGSSESEEENEEEDEEEKHVCFYGNSISFGSYYTFLDFIPYSSNKYLSKRSIIYLAQLDTFVATVLICLKYSESVVAFTESVRRYAYKLCDWYG